MAHPTDPAQIDAAERELGRSLPSALRQRLTANNGGDIHADDDVWQLHPVWDPTDRRTMRSTANHIAKETATARGWARFLRGAIAVASNGTGDLLVILQGEEGVRLWRHDTGEPGSEVQVLWA